MDLSRYQEHYSLSHRLKRYCWYIVNRTLFRLMVTNAMKVPRNLLLRLFGANIPLASLVYPSSKIWAPWNLSVGEYACIGPDTEIYNKAPISQSEILTAIFNHRQYGHHSTVCRHHRISSHHHPLFIDKQCISFQQLSRVLAVWRQTASKVKKFTAPHT